MMNAAPDGARKGSLLGASFGTNDGSTDVILFAHVWHTSVFAAYTSLALVTTRNNTVRHYLAMDSAFFDDSMHRLECLDPSHRGSVGFALILFVHAWHAKKVACVIRPYQTAMTNSDVRVGACRSGYCICITPGGLSSECLLGFSDGTFDGTSLGVPHGLMGRSSLSGCHGSFSGARLGIGDGSDVGACDGSADDNGSVSGARLGIGDGSDVGACDGSADDTDGSNDDVLHGACKHSVESTSLIPCDTTITSLPACFIVAVVLLLGACLGIAFGIWLHACFGSVLGALLGIWLGVGFAIPVGGPDGSLVGASLGANNRLATDASFGVQTGSALGACNGAVIGALLGTCLGVGVDTSVGFCDELDRDVLADVSLFFHAWRTIVFAACMVSHVGSTAGYVLGARDGLVRGASVGVCSGSPVGILFSHMRRTLLSKRLWCRGWRLHWNFSRYFGRCMSW